jgi:hypothetical protein
MKPSEYGSKSHDRKVTASDTRFILTPYNPCMSKQVPTHYRKQPIQPIEIIDAYGLDFKRGNALKYLLRAGSKPGEDKTDDLLKAVWYLICELHSIELADEINEQLLVDSTRDA